MKKLTKEMQTKIYNIEKTKIELGRYLESSLITEKDIFNLLKKDSNYGVRNLQMLNDPKKKMLKNIFNCPFLLCDQSALSVDVKELLPYLLSSRYNTELDNLKVYLEQGFIDENEYDDLKDELRFFYYEYSKDGRCILETGHAFFENEKLKAR
jgi:hypothetical protein